MISKKAWVALAGAMLIGVAWWGLLVWLAIAAIRWLGAHT